MLFVLYFVLFLHTHLQLGHPVLPDEAGRHDNRQQEEDHHAQFGPFHLHRVVPERRPKAHTDTHVLMEFSRHSMKDRSSVDE